MSILIDTIDLTGESCNEDEVEVEVECQATCEADEAAIGMQQAIQVECFADSSSEDEEDTGSPSAFRAPSHSFNTPASEGASSSSSDVTPGPRNSRNHISQESLSADKRERPANNRENQGELASLGQTQPLAPKRSSKAPRTLQPRSLNLEPPRRSARAPVQRKRYSDSEEEDEKNSRQRKRASSRGVNPAALPLAPGTLLNAIIPFPAAARPRLSKRAARADGTPPPPERTDAEEAAAVAHIRAQYRQLFLAERPPDGDRPDRTAMKWLGQAKMLVNQGSRRLLTGDLPGLPVGTLLFNRAEMKVVGMHNTWMAGIDYVPQDNSADGQSYATAVVSSGGYEDDEDNGNTLWYTGAGGNDLLSSRRQTGAQRLEKGNLALHNSMTRKSPVRLLRFLSDKASPEESYTGKLYSYDGLYDVTEFKYEVGKRQHGVYKFRLVRQPGQPPLASQTGAVLHKRLIRLAQRDAEANPR